MADETNSDKLRSALVEKPTSDLLHVDNGSVGIPHGLRDHSFGIPMSNVGNIDNKLSGDGKWQDCEVDGCISRVKGFIPVCTYHWGQAPRKIKTRTQRALQSKDFDGAAEYAREDIIIHWNSKLETDTEI